MRARLTLSLLVATLGACSETLREAPPAPGDAGAVAAGSNAYASVGPTPTSAGGSGPIGGPAPVAGRTGGPGAGGAGGGIPHGASDAGAAGQGTSWVAEGPGRYLDLASPPVGLSEAGDRVVTGDGTLLIDQGPGSTLALATLPIATGLSADGRVVIGQSGPDVCSTPLRWDAAGIAVVGPMGRAVAVSGDGSIVGSTSAADPTCHSPPRRAFFWSAAGGIRSIAPLGDDTDTEMLAVSRSGTTLVGVSSAPAVRRGGSIVVQDVTTGAVSSGRGPPPTGPVGVLVSADGSVVAGTLVGDATLVPFVFSGGELQIMFPAVLPSQTFVADLSADGHTRLEMFTSAPQSLSSFSVEAGNPSLWRGSAPPEPLPGLLPVGSFERTLMTPDGSLIIGNPAPSTEGLVVEWGVQRQPRFLFADAPAFRARCGPFVTKVAVDGQTFAGTCNSTGRATGFVAHVPRGF
jgi:hypothetical protein